MGKTPYDNHKNKVVMWKTKEEMNAWELMELRIGRIMISKTIKGKKYYKI